MCKSHIWQITYLTKNLYLDYTKNLQNSDRKHPPYTINNQKRKKQQHAFIYAGIYTCNCPLYYYNGTFICHNVQISLGKRFEQTLHQRRYMNGKQAHENMINMISPTGKYKLQMDKIKKINHAMC